MMKKFFGWMFLLMPLVAGIGVMIWDIGLIGASIVVGAVSLIIACIAVGAYLLED